MRSLKYTKRFFGVQETKKRFAISASLGLLGVLIASVLIGREQANYYPIYNSATYSSPIAISSDNRLVWSVNPAGNSVSVIRTDTETLIKNIPVGQEPQSVALAPGNNWAYVANAASSNVTVIRITDPNPYAVKAEPYANLTTGAEPWNIVVSPNGQRVFVANSSQDTITVIDASKQRIIGNVDLRDSLCNDPDHNRHFQPRGLAVTEDNSKLYVTRFLSFTAPGGVQGADKGKEGVVCRLDIDTNAKEIKGYTPAAVIRLAPRVTGFEFPGLNQNTLAFPNQLQSMVIRGDQAYLPNIAASPHDPLRLNVDTQAFVNIIDGVNGAHQTDASLSKFFLGRENLGPNLHLGARVPETGKKQLFFANPWGIAFTNQSGYGAGYAISAGSDLLVKVNVAPDGTLYFTGGPSTTRYIDLNDPTNPATSGFNAGKNPQGIVINAAGTTAYTANFVSRNVSVVDLTTDSVRKVISTTALPAPGSKQEVALVGAEVFFSSRGHFDQPPGTKISTDERLAQLGWQSCSSCHFKGFSDGVVWVFNTGPRKSIPLNGTFDPQDRKKDTSEQRVLNYSAIFDEVHDFDLNIRNVSGPGALKKAQPCDEPPPATSTFDPNHGLLLGDDDAELAPCTIVAFVKPNGPVHGITRNEITITLPGSHVPVKALSALNEWVRVAIRTPNGPLNSTQVQGGLPISDVLAGRALFKQAGCEGCHGGNQWTSSIRDFSPPPAVKEIFCETDTGAGTPPGCQKAAVTGNPVNAQYLDKFLRNINSFDLNVPGSGNSIPGQPSIGAVEKATRILVKGVLQAKPQDALGKDFNDDGHGNGFSPPSLLGINAFQPYYHNGACETLACVLADVNHRSAGTGGYDILSDPHDQAQVVRFLESVDANTEPFK
ncbi:MAG: YncE family protein [Acidobacteriaceae bacterium]|nr:YncE family protein [Acidobacteriaceae bacterium]